MPIDIYRDRKPSFVPEEVWEAWIKGFIESSGGAKDIDISLFAQWYYENTLSEIVERLAPVSMKVKEPEKGRWVVKQGMELKDKRWDISRSIASYGRIFAGTRMGFHREYEPEAKGRAEKKVGSFVIIVALPYEDEARKEKTEYTYRQITITEVLENVNVWNTMTVAYAVVKEAQRLNYKVTMIFSPRTIEKDNFIDLNAYDPEDTQEKFIYYWPIVNSDKWPIDTSKFKYYTETPGIRDQQKEWDSPTGFGTMGDRRDMATPLSIFAERLFERDMYIESDTPPTRETLTNIWNGVHPFNFREGRDARRQGGVSYHYRIVNSDRHDQILDMILNMKPYLGEMNARMDYPLYYLEHIWPELETSVRSTVMVIGSTFDWFVSERVHWPYRQLNKDADIYFIDAYSSNREYLFVKQPEFSASKPVDNAFTFHFNYRLDRDNITPEQFDEYITTYPWKMKPRPPISTESIIDKPGTDVWFGRIVIDIDLTDEMMSRSAMDPIDLANSIARGIEKEISGAVDVKDPYSVILGKVVMPRLTDPTLTYIFVGDDTSKMTERVLKKAKISIGGIYLT